MEILRKAVHGVERLFPAPTRPPEKTEEQRKAEATERWRGQVLRHFNTLLSLFSDDLPYFDNQVDSEQSLRMALEYYAKSSQHSGGIQSMLRVDTVPEHIDAYRTVTYGMLNAEGTLVGDMWGEVDERGHVTVKYVMYI